MIYMYVNFSSLLHHNFEIRASKLRQIKVVTVLFLNNKLCWNQSYDVHPTLVKSYVSFLNFFLRLNSRLFLSLFCLIVIAFYYFFLYLYHISRLFSLY
jgi:hypothetical protein